MKDSRSVVWLSWLIAVLAVAASASGLLWRESGESFTFTTVRGQTVEIYGQGLYRYDSRFIGAGNSGTDLVVLSLGVPLLLAASLLYRRGSVRAGMLLLGTLAYFFYVYAGYALGTTAFNQLFFLHVVLFSISLYAFVLAFASFDLRTLPMHFSPNLPRLGPAIFMLASGVVTFVVWAGPVAAAQLQGRVPAGLDHYTTLFTYAFDLAVITPAAIIAGALILRRIPLGYLIALSLLVLEVALAPLIAAQTVSQLMAGVTFSPGEVIGPITGFVTLGLLAAWVLISILVNVSSRPRRE